MLTSRRSSSPRAARRRAARQACALRRVAAAALVAIYVWWLLANPVPGGGILVSVDDRHGLDVVDLVTLPLLALAVWLVWPRRRRETQRLEPAPMAAKTAPTAPLAVLFVCSANQCRSPMAAELLDRRLRALGVPACIRSAGTSAEPGLPALDAAQAAVGGGIEQHRSVPLAAELVAHADLVLGMTRHHVREAVIMCPDAFARSFTVFELARRGRAVGSRRPGESFADWISRAGAGRCFADLAGTSDADELADPIGLGAEAIARSAVELDAALDEITELAWASVPPVRPRFGHRRPGARSR